MRKSLFSLIAIALFCVSLISCSTKDDPTGGNGADTSSTLSVFKLASDGDAPDYNSSTVESIWNSATPLTLTASAMGFSGSSFPVTIKSVVSSQNIYFLVQYDDATENNFQQPLHFHGGDPMTPTNWTVDPTTYDDGVSLIFESEPGTSGAKTFTADGCTMLCHTTTTGQWDKGMFSESTGRYDLWYWHAGKGNGTGYADDEMSVGNPNFGILKDDGNAEIYLNNVIDYAPNPGFQPDKVAGGTNRNLDKRYFIANESAQMFANGVTNNPATGKAWSADDIVSAFTHTLPSDPSNDFLDVHSKGFYSGVKWTVKFQRKLNTGSTLDAQFINGNEYPFSFAIHNNNAPGNHYGVANKSFKLKLP